MMHGEISVNFVTILLALVMTLLLKFVLLFFDSGIDHRRRKKRTDPRIDQLVITIVYIPTPPFERNEHFGFHFEFERICFNYIYIDWSI